MTGEVLKEHTVLGGPIGGASANHGAGLVWGLYEVTTATTLDWIVLPEFEEILFASAQISTGAADPVVISDDTKITFTAATPGLTQVFVVGTPAVETD